MSSTMIDSETKEVVRTQFGAHLQWLISTVLDAAFLIPWLFLEKLTEYLIDHLGLKGQLGTQIFQVIFAVSTLAPIIVFILKDFSIGLIRAIRAVQTEVKKEANSNDIVVTENVTASN